MTVLTVFAVAAGGALGALARYSVGAAALRFLGAGFPYGTLAVNVTGAFILGLTMGWISHSGHLTPDLQKFWIIGFLGAFTTFSAFTMETLTMLQRQEYMLFALYTGGSVILALVALAAGLYMARTVPL